MPNYITLEDMANTLGIYEYQIRTTAPSGTEDAGYEVDDTLTGATSSETMVVQRVVTNEEYFVNQVSGAHTLGEGLTDGADTSKLLMSDAVALSTFIDRAESIVKTIIRHDYMNTGTAHVVNLTTKKRRNLYKLPVAKLPIIAISAITSEGVAYTGVDQTDYYLNKEHGLIDFKDGTQAKDALYSGNLVITYTYGNASATIADVPPIVQQGVIEGVSRMWGRYNQESVAPGATSVSPAGFSMQFNYMNLFTEEFMTLLRQEARILA